MGGHLKPLWYDPPGGLERLVEYCATDVLTEKACAALLPSQPQSSIDLWRLTTKINERGIFCDLILVARAKQFADRYESELLEELRDLTKGKVRTAKQTAKLKEWLAENGVEIPSVDKANVAEALRRKDISPGARRALEIRRALAMSSVTKLIAMEAMAGADGRIRGTLLYHGASTGRYSGRGIQPQNYPRGSFKDVENIFAALEIGDYEFFKALFPNVFVAVSSSLRGMLRASPGCRFLAADYNAIEARVVMWLAECQVGIDLFESDVGVYEGMAQEIYGIKNIKDVTEDQRQLGKQAILGSGFSMGDKKFKITCQGYGMNVDEKLAKLAIKTYREKFSEVVDFWRMLNEGALLAVQSKKRINCLRLQLLMKGKFLFIRLPSGRKLAYYEPKIEWKKKPWGMQETLTYMAVDSETKQWRREETYGGKLFENCLGGNTKIFTSNGIKDLKNVTIEDLVFDGEKWVAHEGLIVQGNQKVILCHGIQVTPDHLILDGNSWKEATQWTAKGSRDVPKTALVSVLSWLSKGSPEKTRKAFSSAIAEKEFLSTIERFSETKLPNAANAPIESPERNAKNIWVSSRMKLFRRFGSIVFRALSPDALTPNATNLKTMEEGGLKYLRNGSKIEQSSLNILRPFLIGTRSGLTSIESTMKKIMNPETYGSLQGLSIVTTEEQRLSSNSEGKSTLSNSFGKSFAQNGRVQILLDSILRRAEALRKSWSVTVPVFDLRNAGDLHRFMILTDSGPVIVHNCVQGIAADVMTDAMIRLEKYDYPLVLSVHDELVADVPNERGSLKEFEELMAKIEPWAEGLLVKVKGWEKSRFKK